MPPEAASPGPFLRGLVCAAAVLAAVVRPAPAGPPAAGAEPPRPAAPPGEGASPARPGSTDTTPAPGRAVEEARDAQRAFERYRRRHLPYSSGRRAERCDEHVGRYCLWHGDGGADREPPPDPPGIRRRREALLGRLARAAARAPGSGWIAGQRVRYLLEAGRGGEAVSVARSCAARRWWCRALEGHALHRTGRHQAADAAFDDALAAMPAAVRRRWTDVSVLLEGEAAEAWEEAGPEGRARLARRLWRLSDPLHLAPGSERRAEHLSRRTAARLLRDASSPFGDHWDDGLEELLLRYGAWVGWERSRPGPSRLRARPLVTGIHDPDALRFLPEPSALVAPLEAGPEGWPVDDPRPRSSHAPAHADTVGSLPHVLSLFPRGDSTVVVAAFEAFPGEAVSDTAVEAGLHLWTAAELDGPGSGPPAARARRPGTSAGVLSAVVPARPHLLSLEALDREGRRAGRARYALRLSRRPEGVPGLSDLLLHRAGASPARTLEEASARAAGPGPLRPGTPLGLYWEVYGPRRVLEGMEVSVALTDQDGDLLERLAGLLGLGDGEVTGVRWRDRPGRRGRVHPRSLRVRIPEELPEGRYRLELAVELEGYDPMVARRSVTVERGDG